MEPTEVNPLKVKLKGVRIAFPNLFQAKTVGGEGDPAFSSSFIFAKDHPCVKLIEAALMAAAVDKWGAKGDATLKELRAKDKLCLHDGDTKSGYDGFPGNLFISSRNKVRPLVIDSNKAILDQSSGRPYSGCYVNGTIELWAQDNKYGKRINASLSGVQFYRDGEAFAGGVAANPDDFDDVTDVDEAAALAKLA